jgi:hypothetical protein
MGADPQNNPPVPAGPAEALDPHEAVMSPEAVAHRKALAHDWSQYVAVVDIPYGNVLAYRAGDPVPASNVKRWQYDTQGFVAKTGTKAATAAVESAALVSPSTIKAPGDSA